MKMRISRTAALAVGLMTLGSAAAFAQATPSSTAVMYAKSLTERLKSELSLTPQQETKVQEINVASASEVEQLLQKYSGDTTAAGDAALVKGVLRARQSNQEALKKVLTPVQWNEHQRNKAQRLASTQTELMAYDLGLTTEQLLEVQRINLDGANQLYKAIDKLPATPKPTRQQLREAAKPVFEARDAELQRILTAAQWTKLQENRRALRDILVEQAETTVAVAKKP
jgi:hypothetical protein